MRDCCMCHASKHESDFGMHSKGRLRRNCRACDVVRARAYMDAQLASPDTATAFRRKKQKRLTQWRRDHPEAVKAKARARRPQDHARRRIREASNPALYLFRGARDRAKRRGLPFTIVVGDVIVPTHCPVLGIPLARTGTRGRCHSSPSLDRIVPALGYVPGNVIVVSSRANSLKQDASTEEIAALYRFYCRG